jgi:hypothetical protein
MEKEILRERERIKKIIIRKFEGAIISREKLKGYYVRHSIPLSRLKRLQEDIFFLIANPDYIKVKDRKENQT